MNTKNVIEEMRTEAERIGYLIENYRTSMDLPAAARLLCDRISLFCPRPAYTIDPDWGPDRIYEEVKKQVPGTLAFGDFHPDVCQRVCQLFEMLDERMQRGEYPRRWTNA